MQLTSVLIVAIAGAMLGGATVSPGSEPGVPTPALAAATRSVPRTSAPVTVGETAIDLAAAAEATVASGTVRVRFEIEFTGSTQIPEGARILGEGQTGFGPTRRMRLTLDLTALGGGGIDMIVDEPFLYVRGDALASLVPAGKWLAVDLASTDPRVNSFREIASGQNDASLALYYLLGADGAIEVVGQEIVNDTETTHVAMPIDLDRALSLAPLSVRPALEANIAEMAASLVEPGLDAEAWIDGVGMVHRAVYRYRLSPSLGGGQMAVIYHFSRFGEPLELGIPDAADVVLLADTGATT